MISARKFESPIVYAPFILAFNMICFQEKLQQLLVMKAPDILAIAKEPGTGKATSWLFMDLSYLLVNVGGLQVIIVIFIGLIR